MAVDMLEFGGVALVGIGATVVMDIWAVISQRIWGSTPANYCFVGRWFCHMPAGQFIHPSIAKAQRKSGECLVGWAMHYLIGIAYAFALVTLTSGNWLHQPGLLLALAFGLATLVFPFLVMQPAFGLGFASARSPNPWQARLKSMLTHLAFGAGLYLSALVVRVFLDTSNWI